ncbi:MAG TPA: glycoside hydrolase family 3 N-terminal domain-containing protein, partial [Bacilli bacterium]|nr:glycoside hydrolase family 3 N-terminal domain-containing protein [Bacilli bacterium]
MITKLTIKEKISLLNGKTAWLTKNIDRIQLPSLEMSDGPHGIRKEKENSREALPATLFPPTTTLASTFNKELAYQMGSALAQEAKEKGVKLILAPGVNIKRNPGCGRNFEYYSEDPILSGEMASSYISGIQSENVGACVKHFAANSQEKYRLTIDSVVDERALREIYLPSFKKAVESNVATIMACYNKVNGIHGCENKELLTDILRNEWGF